MSYWFRQEVMKARKERTFSGKTRVYGFQMKSPSEVAARFPEAKPLKFSNTNEVAVGWPEGKEGANDWLPIERSVSYKEQGASRHECGPRCQKAKGQTCECVCDGANHGILSQ